MDRTGRPSGPWTADESACVLDAIDRVSNTEALIRQIMERTGRSHRAVKRRLVRIGHLKRGPSGASVRGEYETQ